MVRITSLCSAASINYACPTEKEATKKERKQFKDQAEELERIKKVNQAKYRTEVDNMIYQMKPMIGDATETGCVKFVWPVKDVEQTRVENPMVPCGKEGKEKTVIPFNSDNKFMLSVHTQHEG